MKIGRNDPCPCLSGKKYKKCCQSDDAKAATMKKQRVITLSRRDFIGEPYTDCPSCKRSGTFGRDIMMGSSRFYNKECVECPYKESFPLPPIKKTLIYLDQLAISNMMKALNPRSKSRERILAEQPYWLEMFKKLDILSKQQLITCPDSSYHRDESIVGEDFDSMVRIYEHLSHGATFFDHVTIERFQVAQHFRNYLDGKSDAPLELNAEKITYGDLHTWQGGIRVSVKHKPLEGEIDGLRAQRESSYQSFLPIFERWKSEHSKKFEDWVLEEAGGLGKGTWEAFGAHMRKQIAAPEKYARTGEVDLDDVIPPRSNDILIDMMHELGRRGITDGAAFMKMNEYFNSVELLQVPFVRITSLLLAAIARQASLGRKNPPSRGMFNDMYAIGSLLPYCDAMFVDREMAGLLTNNPVKKEMGFPTKVFSVANRDEFMSYLDSLSAAASSEHMKVVGEVYGEVKPYVSILQNMQR